MPHCIRHCVECRTCHTRYLLGFSPYRNGSYLSPSVVRGSEEYTLYCTCGRPAVCTKVRYSELKTYTVSKVAHYRGYGTSQEISVVGRNPNWLGLTKLPDPNLIDEESNP
jgi:hypothetical protein